MRQSYLFVLVRVAMVWDLTENSHPSLRSNHGLGWREFGRGCHRVIGAVYRSRAMLTFLAGEVKGKKMRHERCFDRAGRPVTQLVSAMLRAERSHERKVHAALN